VFEEGEKERKGGAKARQRPRQYTRVYDRDGVNGVPLVIPSLTRWITH
jgi:hypothetical protein